MSSSKSSSGIFHNVCVMIGTRIHTGGTEVTVPCSLETRKRDMPNVASATSRISLILFLAHSETTYSSFAFGRNDARETM